MSNYYNSGLYLEPFFTKHKHLALDFDYFEYVVGEELTKEILQILS